MKSTTLPEALTKNKNFTNKGIIFINDSGKDTFISYKNLYQKALVRLYYFQNLAGLHPGDKLIFQIEDNLEFIISFWACQLGGIIPVPLTFANNSEVIIKLLNVWRVLGYSRVIMPAKLLKKIQKHIDGLSARSVISFDHFKQVSLSLEDVNSWEETNTNNGEPAKVTPDDLAFIQFSSGSTGDPKGVMLKHKNVISNIYDISPTSQWNERDKSLSWMPLTHDMGLIGLHLTPLVLKCDQYLMSTFHFAFYPLTWLQKIHEYAITITSCPNFGFEHFLSFLNDKDFKGANLSSLRIILNGAEPISYKVCQHFLARLEPYNLRQNVIMPVYGLAEGTLAVTNNPVGETIKTHQVDRNSLTMGSKITSSQNGGSNNMTTLVDCGTPVGKVKLDIRDEQGTSLPEETVGLIHIKGKNVTSGYFNNPAATGELIKNGWLNTGDLGFIKDKRLTIIGRQKEVLFVNGQNFYANDLERVAHEVEGVEMGKVGVCGIENSTNGCDDILVFVQFKNSLDFFIPLTQKVKQVISKQTGVPIKHVIPVRKMPITTSGKVQRFALKESFLKGEYDEVVSNIEKSISPEQFDIENFTENTTNEFEKIILSVWENNTKKTLKIGLDDNFFEAGGESLLIAKVAADLAKEYPGKIAVTDFFAYPTVAKLAAILKERIKGQGDIIKTVQFKETLIDTNGKGNFNCTVKIGKEQLNLIFNDQIEIKQLEQLILSAYAIVIGKISEQPEVTIYLARNNENTFLPCHINLSDDIGFFQLLNSIHHELDKCVPADNAILENYTRPKQLNRHQLCFMLTRQVYCGVHNRNIAQTFDCTLSFSFEQDLVLLFMITGSLKKEAANILVNSIVSVIQKLAEHVKSTTVVNSK